MGHGKAKEPPLHAMHVLGGHKWAKTPKMTNIWSVECGEAALGQRAAHPLKKFFFARLPPAIF